jgi:NAD(P)-dependent dehydrogenase (short-subunit alcohol dehydrogenase family)
LNTDRSILFATDTPSMRSLGDQLSAELLVLPALDEPESFEAWRAEVGAVADCSRVIVSVWNATPMQGALVEQEQEAWLRRFEHPYLLWNFALGAAARRCRDGGAIVALVQTPAALDAAGWTPEMSIGDGVVALVRSLAASEGPRRIRANAVTTPIPMVGETVIAPRPPLDGFPGRLDEEVAGALRLLLSSDASGLTGRVVAADGGRSLA